VSGKVIGLLAFAVLAGALSKSEAANADAIQIFSTGVDANGNVLPAGSVDSHWTVQTEPYDQNDHSITATGPQTFLTDYNGATYVGSSAYRPNPAAGGLAYTGIDTAHAGTIAWSANNNSGYAAYTYRTTFNLNGLNPTTANISLTFFADDDAELALNGVLIPSTYDFRNGEMTVDLSSGFISGLNTLDLVTYNEGGAGGGFVQINSATATPEPAPLWIMGFGVAALGLARRRRRAV